MEAKLLLTDVSVKARRQIDCMNSLDLWKPESQLNSDAWHEALKYFTL